MAKKPITIGGKRVKWYSVRLTKVSGERILLHYGDLSMDAVRKRILTSYYRPTNIKIKLLKRRPKGW